MHKEWTHTPASLCFPPGGWDAEEQVKAEAITLDTEMESAF